MLQTGQKCDKMLPVQGGWLVCPTCRRNRHLLRIRPETEARALQVYCRVCRTEHLIDITRGQCFESQGQ